MKSQIGAVNPTQERQTLTAIDVAIGGHGSRDDALNVRFPPFRDLRRRRAIKSAQPRFGGSGTGRHAVTEPRIAPRGTALAHQYHKTV